MTPSLPVPSKSESFSAMETTSFDQNTVYSQTHRIVLLLDLDPLLHLHDPTPYITSLLCSTRNLLSFPPLSSSLFTFKLFFSSLSPLLSSSKLQQPSRSLTFDQPSFTLVSLHKTLNSLPEFHQTSSTDQGFFPHALNLAASMRQILYDYPWEPVMRSDPLTGNIENHYSLISSNLVVLLSPICRSIKGFSKFLNVELADQCSSNVDMFSEKFCRVFRNVKDAFDCRDIHISWIDVRYEVGIDVSTDEREYQIIRRLFEDGTKRFGWGFCSTDSIILGSALVPFGLIYPKIGMSLNYFDAQKCSKKLRAQLSLQISDVSGKPLEFRCCDLELLNLASFPNKYPSLLIVQDEVVPKITSSDKKSFWEKFGDRSIVIIVEAVLRYEEVVKFQGHFTDSILLREFSKGSGKEHKMVPNEFFADKVLEMLAMEFGNVWKKNSLPIWQILLSFLYRQGYCAMVSIMNGSEDLHKGILRPFTISSGLLYLLDESEVVQDFSGLNALKCFRRIDNDKDAHVKSNLKGLDMLRSFTWSTFCKAAIKHTELDLYEVYIAAESNDRKKKKFLKCWMKQIKNCEGFFFPPKSNTNENIVKDFSNRVGGPNNDTEIPFSVSTAGENSLTDASRVQDEGTLGFMSETAEEFFDNLPRKIQQGLGSEVDLGAFAYRLVSSSIHWLNHKVDREATSDAGTPVKKYGDDYGTSVASELTELLLREPKDISIGHKTDNNASSQAVSTGSAALFSEDIVKESELQILFRMEVLQSEIGGKIAETVKQKFIKQICFLLDNIQCRMEGGFFGDWNLDNYVAKIIKSRYSHTLGDVVHKIYTRMDLLLFAEEEDSSNQLLNSEDSSKSWREKPERKGMADDLSSSGRMSAEYEHPQLSEDNGEGLPGYNQEDNRRAIEAKERRERARRFASSTSWMPDLRRVWAPKQKLMRPKSDSHLKLRKRKKQKASYDKVCETPMTENKRPNIGIGNSDDIEYDSDHRSHQPCGSVFKALFQDDE